MAVVTKVLFGTFVVTTLAAAPKLLKTPGAEISAARINIGELSANEAALYYLSVNDTTREYVHQNIGSLSDKGRFVYRPSFLDSISNKSNPEVVAGIAMRNLMENKRREAVISLKAFGFEVIAQLDDGNTAKYTFWKPERSFSMQ